MQGAQKVAWADNAIKLAVDMTVAAIARLDLHRLERRAGDAGARRDPDRVPGVGHPGARGPRGPLLEPPHFSHRIRRARRCPASGRRAYASVDAIQRASVGPRRSSTPRSALLIALLGHSPRSRRSVPAPTGAAASSARRSRASCAARAVGPGPCWRDPLTEAYGRPLAGRGARAGARARSWPQARRARCCRSTFAAAARSAARRPGRRPGLTASNRRVTAFVSVDDARRSDGGVTITYWLYRPTLGLGAGARGERAPPRSPRLASTPLPDDAVPALVAARDAGRPQSVRVPGRRGAAVALADRSSTRDLGAYRRGLISP